MMRSFFEETRNQGLALILGEKGADMGLMELATFQSTMHAFNLGLEFGIGILHWGWEDPRFPLVDPDSVPGRINVNTGDREAGFGFEIDRTDGTRPTNLSWMGELFWDWTRGTLTAPVPIYDWPFLINGNFEEGTLGWMPYFGGVAVPTDSIREGYNYIRFSDVWWGGLFNSQQLDEITYNRYAREGYSFRLSAYGRIEPAGSTQPLRIAYRLTDSPDIERFIELNFDSADWTYNEIVFTLPDNIYTINLLVHSGTADKVFSLSNIVIELVDDFEPPELCEECGEEYPCECEEQPTLCPDCNQVDCECVQPPTPCTTCGNYPCTCTSVVTPTQPIPPTPPTQPQPTSPGPRPPLPRPVRPLPQPDTAQPADYDTSIIITIPEQRRALDRAEDIVIEVDDILTLTIPDTAVDYLTEGGYDIEELHLHIQIHLPTEYYTDIFVEISMTKAGEPVTEANVPIVVEVNLTDLGFDDANPMQIVAVLYDGTIVRGELDTETIVFIFETTVIGNFTVMYAPSLRIIHMAIGSYDIDELVTDRLLIEMDVVPVIQNDRTFIPLRFVAYALDAQVSWYEPNREVTITRNGQVLTFAIGEAAPGMDAPAFLLNDRTMVPLRFVAEFFNATVAWHEETQGIEILQK